MSCIEMFSKTMRLTTSIMGPVMVGVCIIILAQNAGQAQGLTCIDCADFVFNGSLFGTVVTPILNALPKIRNKNCGTATTKSSGFNLTTCPPNPTSGDRVYRCGAYTGILNVVVPVAFPITLPINVHLIDRECVLVNNGLSNGCHTQSFTQRSAHTFQRIFDILNTFGVVNFKGDICITEDASTASPTASPTASSIATTASSTVSSIASTASSTACSIHVAHSVVVVVVVCFLYIF